MASKRGNLFADDLVNMIFLLKKLVQNPLGFG
jgi:hypothetical protein